MTASNLVAGHFHPRDALAPVQAEDTPDDVSDYNSMEDSDEDSSDDDDEKVCAARHPNREDNDHDPGITPLGEGTDRLGKRPIDLTCDWASVFTSRSVRRRPRSCHDAD